MKAAVPIMAVPKAATIAAGRMATAAKRTTAAPTRAPCATHKTFMAPSMKFKAAGAMAKVRSLYIRALIMPSDLAVLMKLTNPVVMALLKLWRALINFAPNPTPKLSAGVIAMSPPPIFPVMASPVFVVTATGI